MAEDKNSISNNIEDLAAQQKQLGEDIQKILVNYRKDSETRKTKIYLEKRLKDLDDKWETFIENNKALEELKPNEPEHAYFLSNFYDKIEDTYNIAKRILETKLSEILHVEEEDNATKQTGDAPKSGTIPKIKRNETIINQPKMQEQNTNRTLLIEFINKIQREESVEHPKAYYKHKIQMLNNYWSRLASTHVEIMANLTEASENSEYFENNEYSQLEDIYQETIIKLQSAHDALDHQAEASTTFNINQPLPQKIKLPPLQIPKFDGDYKNWSSFQDLFKQLIHGNVGLGNAQKLYYLKSNLVGEASKMLQHLKVTDDNYDIAWELLNNRYNNTRLLVASQLQRLITFPTSQSESANNLKLLHDTAKECLGAIRNLKVKTDDWGPLLVHILTQKLDKESHRHYEERLKNPREVQSLEEFFSFLEYRFQTLETIGKKENSNQRISRSSSHIVKQTPSSKTNESSSSTRTKDGYRCTLCRSNHHLYGCNSFRVMNSQKRRDHVRKHNLCFNCLRPDHDIYNCKSRSSCRVCSKRHNTLLHSETKQADNFPTLETAITNTEKHEATPVRSHVAHAESSPLTTQIILATAIVKVPAVNGNFLTLRALIDQGSQATFISENAVQQLGLKKSRVSININGIGNNCTETVRTSVEIIIKPRFPSKFECRTTALILKKLTNKIPSQPIHLENCTHMHNLVLADPTYFKPGKIDIIIGADIFTDILLSNIIKGPKGTPLAQHTRLGWILSGKVYNKAQDSNIVLCTVTNIDDQLRQFWEIEDIPEKKHLSEEDNKCEQLYENTVRRDQNGRYIVRLPFNDKLQDHPIGESRHKAVARLLGLERKFQRDKNLEAEYRSFMNEYRKLGHMKLREIPFLENSRQFFLPHHAVYKTDSTTTKLRVVFDASAKSTSGMSLNDKLLTGPTLQHELFDIILRWRKHKYAYKADIEKMYRQIKIAEIDQQFQCILWRDSPDESIKEYQLTTVTYGTRSAPYLAVRTLRQLALDEGEKFPIGAEITNRDFYVDDLISGSDTLMEAQNAINQLTRLLAAGGFTLRKWASHCSLLLRDIPQKHVEMRPVQFNGDTSESIKALGLLWHPHNDTFTFKVEMPTSKTTPTKRSFLSEASKIFDPLGWLTPTTIVTKIMFQDLWLAGLNWDDQLPSQLAEKWIKFKNDLSLIQELQLPRWINHRKESEVKEIHAFCDASEKAYAAVVYFRTLDHNGEITINLLTAKSKVAPINKKPSLPRLELCAAVLLANLVKKVKKAMDINTTEIHAWTDSTVVLAWLKGHPSKWKTFVANRVSEIQSVFNANQWHHIRSQENPADQASRGIQPRQLLENSLWWNGPELLKENPIRFPYIREHHTDLEKRRVHTYLEISSRTTLVSELVSRYSSLKRVNKILAYCLRFIANTRKSKPNRICGPITATELELAHTLIIKAVQQEEFAEDIVRLKKGKQLKSNSPLRTLDPFLDSEEVVRVGGRLRSAEMEYDRKHPIILPYEHALTTLVIQQSHQATLHGGNQLTLAHTRLKYWILKGQSAIKQHLHRCVICFRQKAQSREQLMGNLPKPRTMPGRPFTNAGVDYAGPINLRLSKERGSKIHKGYIVIFICLATKAVHLEAATDLTAEGFIATFKRCVGRRGIIKNLYSDNGSNFVLANKILQLNMTEFRTRYEHKVLQATADIGTVWHFIPPSSPHFGGLWEAGVKSTKYHLKRIIGENNLTYEELSTFLIQVEACLNSRPLCPMSSDPEDLTVLTPGHFLIGSSLLAPPSDNLEDYNLSTLTRWRLIEKLHQDFWKKWSSEYLSRLQERPKWVTRENNIRPGQLVIVKDEQLPPTRWALARIVDVHPGSDGLVRVATIKTKNHTTKRPINKLCVLPVVDNEEPIEITSSATGQIMVPKPQSNPDAGSTTTEEDSYLKRDTSTSCYTTITAQPACSSATTSSKSNQDDSFSHINYDLLLQRELRTAKAVRHYVGRKIRPVTTPYKNLVDLDQQNDAKIKLNKRLARADKLDPNPNKRRKPSAQQVESPGRSHTTPVKATLSKTSMLLMLALFLMPILAQIQTNPIQITKFETSPGLYFEEMGEVRIINSIWNILAFYELQTFWTELDGIKHSIGLLKEICNTTKIELPFCSDISMQLELQLTHIEENNEMLQKMNQNEHIRKERGALDIVGTIANKLFGVLDADYAKYINEEIDKTRQNERYLLTLIKNQTSVIESTVNIFKKNDDIVKAQFEEIHSQIKVLSQLARVTGTDQRASRMFTLLATHTILIMNSCQKTQNALIDTVTDVHHGKINPLLITPLQLREQITKIKEHLPSTLTLPGKGDSQILLLYKLLTVRTRVLPTRVLFSIGVPLLINEFYQLYKPIPIPTPFNNSFVLIEPSSDYISVGLHKDQYYPMTEREVDECSHLEIGNYLCKQSHPIYNMYSNESRCEIDLLNHQKTLSATCKIRTIKPSKFWIQLHQANEWLYSLDQEYTVNVICSNSLQPHTLKGSGIIKLREDCTIKQSSMTITGHKLYQSRLSASLLPTINLTKQLLEGSSILDQSPPLYLGSSKKEVEDIVSKLKQLQEQERLPERLNTYDVHHFTITYFLLALILVGVAYYIHKQRSTFTCCTKKQEEGKPIPARRSTHLTMDDFRIANATP